jgi:hypothetical protein
MTYWLKRAKAETKSQRPPGALTQESAARGLF